MTFSAQQACPGEGALVLATLGTAILGRTQADGTTIGLLERGKPLAVVVYLALAPDQTASRDRLIDLLWSDRDPESARNGLRQALWSVRRQVDQGLFRTSGDFVSLARPLTVDVVDFAVAVARGDCEGAIHRYTGDFLPDFATPGGIEFEQWADLERQRYRTLFAHCGESLVRHALGAGQARQAVALARRVRDATPHREASGRLLLEALIADRDTTGALLEAEALDREYGSAGSSLEPATHALVRIARQGDQITFPPAVEPLSLLAELVGRAREFASLVGYWHRAEASEPQHVRIIGAAGLGKTRLLTDFHARVRSTRGRVVSVRGTLAGRTIAYALASDIAGALVMLPGARGISRESAAVLVALNPICSGVFDVAADRAGGDELLRRRLNAVAELVDAVTDEQAIVLLVDDWHWADATSQQLLEALVARLTRERLLLVTASRPLIGRHPDAGVTEAFMLQALDSRAVHQLLASLAALPVAVWTDDFPERLRAATGGSPLLILETLRLALDRGTLRRSDGQWDVGDVRALDVLVTDGSALRHRIEALATPEREAALLLAVSGIPLDPVIVERISSTIAQVFEALERRGIASYHNQCWLISHDELADAITELATADARRVAHAALGRAFLGAAGATSPINERALRVAAQHAWHGSESTGLDRCFRLYVRHARATGDGRSLRALATELLAEHAHPTDVRRLVRSIPGTTRLWLEHRRLVMATMAILALIALSTTTALAWRRTPPAPPAATLALIERDSTGNTLRGWAMPIYVAGWGTERVIDVSIDHRPTWRLAGGRLPFNKDVVVGPNGWTTAESTPDGTISLFARDLDGSRRRLTRSPHADITASWAPDGSRLVFATARWDPLSHYDLAIYDTTTRSIRPFTAGEDVDLGPIWSPDGSRIAFTRRVWATSETQICLIDADGARLACRGIPGMRLIAVLGWFDAHHLLIHTKRDDVGQLVSVDLDGGRVTILDEGVLGASVSPDGRWVLCECVRRGLPNGAWIVYPAERPADYVSVRSGLLSVGTRALWWAPTSPRPPFADSLAIVGGQGSPQVGTTYQLRARAEARNGIPVDLGTVRWRSLDTAVGDVDSTGLLHVHTVGRLRIEASAGGWRRATTTLDVQRRTPQLLMDEDWHGGRLERWSPYGTPAPVVRPSATGQPMFQNQGDDWYVSGVHSRASFPTRFGLTIEADVETPITLGQWQSQSVGLYDTAIQRRALASEVDRRLGNLPAAEVPRCNITYPGGSEGAGYADSIVLQSRPLELRAPVPRTLGTGQRFVVRVDLLPDGRCAFAVDGRPLWVSPPATFADSAVVDLAGQSVKTTIRVGRVRVRTGANSEIDWSRAEGSRVTRGSIVPTRSARTP